MANDLYNPFRALLLTGGINLSTGNYKVAGVSSAYTYSASHQFLSSLTGIVATSGNLASLSVSSGKWDAADPTFTAATGSPIVALVVYKDTGTAGTSPLVCYIDTDSNGNPLNTFPTGIDLAITLPTSGIVNI